jgi:serpin B
MTISLVPLSYSDYALAEAVYPKSSSSGIATTDSAFNASLRNFINTTTSEILQDDTANQMYSPLSLYFALSMLAECASGDTLQEILSVLQQASLSYNREQCKKLYQNNYIDYQKCKLTIANSIWVNKGIPSFSYKQEVLNLLAEYYYASTFGVDFSKASVANSIAGWIRSNTNNLLGDESDFELSQDTLMVLLNTIYFKERWSSEFSSANNFTDTFDTVDSVVNVEYMKKVLDSTYYVGDNYTAASLYYDVGGQRMTFVLPNEGTSVYDLLENTTVASNDLSLADTYLSEITYTVPKFKFSAELDLVDSLKALGMTSAFSQNADFSAALNDMDALVSSVKQKLTICIDEEGTEAAAYTSINLEDTSEEPQDYEKVDFVLNKPFIFTISNNYGEVLFVGVVNNPNM